MTCPSCGVEALPGNRFCASCGASLERVCQTCGKLTEPGASFCSSCGTRLDTAPQAPAPGEERKVVTVLYADLVGSTAAADRLDPEDVRARLAPYHARLRDELARVGGTVEKFIGDAVVALFGAPVAHEDDPERAVRAAFAIHDAIEELNAADPTLGLEVRIGVHTGEALVSLGASPHSGESMAAGDVMNTGARLQSAAPAGGILVGQATYRATRHAVEYGECQSVIAKGKALPVPAWTALALREGRGDEGLDAPLVGRAEELDVLVQALARVRRDRASQLVTIVGVPGIGKSRLVFELFAAAGAEPVERLEGRSLPYGDGLSLLALAEMVKAHVGIAESDSAGNAVRKLEDAADEVIADPDEARWVTEHLRPLVGLASGDVLRGDRRAEAFAAWRRFFEALAERRPLALVLEDLHWADDGLLDFLDYLLDWAADVPLLVLATARPELLERRPGWGGGKRSAISISLAPLGEKETEDLLVALLDRDVLPSEVQRIVLEHSGGNPLYAGEYVRMLNDRGLLHRNGSGDLARSRELPLPESVQGIIAARLDGLPPEEKAVIQDAALVGQVFWVGSLAAIGSQPGSLVEDRLRMLERKEFVRRERASSIANELQYTFRHVLVQEVAYAQLARARRAQNHRLTAEWIESLPPERADDRAELLAHHYLRALELGRAAGQDVSGLADKARRAAVDAGTHAATLNAHATAARFYRAALDLMPLDDPERGELLLRVGEARFHAEHAGAEELEEAREALLLVGDRERAAAADVMAADLLVNQGMHASAQEHLERAAALVRDEPPTRAKVFVLSNWSRFLVRTQKPEEAIVVGREALAMAELLGLDDLRARSLNNIGAARLARGDQGGLEDFERSLAIADAIKSPESVRGYRFLAATLAIQGELPRAFELFAEGRRAAERFGDAFEERWLSAACVIESYWRGRWTEAVRLAEAFIAATQGGSPHYMETTCLRVRGLIRLARDDVAGAVDDAERGLAIARKANDPWFLNQSLAFRARAFAVAGEPAEALLSADELLSIWTTSADSPVPSFEAFDLAVGLVTLGHGADLAPVDGTTPWLHAASAFARSEFLEAAEILAKIGSRPDEAYARLFAARAGVAEGELERALAFFDEVDATTQLNPDATRR